MRMCYQYPSSVGHFDPTGLVWSVCGTSFLCPPYQLRTLVPFFTSWEHTYEEWKTREAGGDDSCWTICVQYASFYSWLVFTGRKPKEYEECVDLLCSFSAGSWRDGSIGDDTHPWQEWHVCLCFSGPVFLFMSSFFSPSLGSWHPHQFEGKKFSSFNFIPEFLNDF